jgi:hypothetical protein
MPSACLLGIRNPHFIEDEVRYSVTSEIALSNEVGFLVRMHLDGPNDRTVKVVQLDFGP